MDLAFTTASICARLTVDVPDVLFLPVAFFKVLLEDGKGSVFHTKIVASDYFGF